MKKIVILSYLLAFDAPIRGVPVGISAPPLVWEKKISLFVLAQLRNVTNRQTDTG